jgi:hypothetical protein
MAVAAAVISGRAPFRQRPPSMSSDFDILIPTGWLRIARQFTAGYCPRIGQVPTGRLKSAAPVVLGIFSMSAFKQTKNYACKDPSAV